MFSMTPKFEIPRPEDAKHLRKYFTMRPCRACESGWIDFFIWADYYRVRYHAVEDEALLVIMKNEREYFAALPYCAEEKLPEYFELLKRFFNDVLEQAFKIYLADEEGVMALRLKENPEYIVREEADFRDYIYDAEELRTLPGRKFQKKRNLINKFCKEYEGRWSYRTLQCADRAEILSFLNEWFPNHAEADADGATTLRFERDGLTGVLQDCCHLTYRIGGIMIDGRLRAFSLGTYNAREEMACISVEKADPEIPGLYQLINREFLLHEFPEAKIVNREDDMGLPGVRQAKLSYNPVAFENKYMVVQKEFRGEAVEIFDPFEDEVAQFGKTGRSTCD